jgi:hypothetical protein
MRTEGTFQTDCARKCSACSEGAENERNSREYLPASELLTTSGEVCF